jgi:3-oxoacid CoA-transferase
LIRALTARGVKDLTCVTNTAGTDEFGIGMLIKNGQVKRVTTSYLGGNKRLEKEYLAGNIELEMVPQGTLAEKLRCGGSGIPAFYTRTGVGTVVERGGLPIKYKKQGAPEVSVRNCDGTTPVKHPTPFTSEFVPEIVASPKQVDEFGGERFLRESSLVCDFGLVKAWKGDTLGNLIFRGTAQNFNPDVARAGKFTIAEVEELVPAGTFKPEEVHLPGVFVNRIVQGTQYDRRIEVPRFSDSPPGKARRQWFL